MLADFQICISVTLNKLVKAYKNKNGRQYVDKQGCSQYFWGGESYFLIVNIDRKGFRTRMQELRVNMISVMG